MANNRGGVRKILATTQGKTYTVVLITFFMLVLMFFLAVRPAFLSITDQNEQNEEKREYLEQLNEKEDALKQLALQDSQYSDQIETLDEMLPQGRNDELVVANIAALAEQYNCTLVSVSFEPDAFVEDEDLFIHPSLTAVGMSFTTVCPTSNQQLMLGGVESLPIPIRIADFSYSQEEAQLDEVAENEYSLAVSGIYYFWNSF